MIRAQILNDAILEHRASFEGGRTEKPSEAVAANLPRRLSMYMILIVLEQCESLDQVNESVTDQSWDQI